MVFPFRLKIDILATQLAHKNTNKKEKNYEK